MSLHFQAEEDVFEEVFTKCFRCCKRFLQSQHPDLEDSWCLWSVGTVSSTSTTYVKYLWYIPFYAPGLKGLQGHLVIGSSVCLSVPLFGCLSVIPSHLQTKCNILSLGYDTVINIGLLVHVWVPHASLTSHAPGVGRGQNVGLRDFCYISTLLPLGASVFHKHMSSFSGTHVLL